MKKAFNFGEIQPNFGCECIWIGFYCQKNVFVKYFLTGNEVLSSDISVAVVRQILKCLSVDIGKF